MSADNDGTFAREIAEQLRRFGRCVIDFFMIAGKIERVSDGAPLMVLAIRIFGFLSSSWGENGLGGSENDEYEFELHCETVSRCTDSGANGHSW